MIIRCLPPDHHCWHFLGGRSGDTSIAAFFHMPQVQGINMFIISILILITTITTIIITTIITTITITTNTPMHQVLSVS